MRTPLQKKSPTFFWQGLLIVLPVAVLASLGLLSLRQDLRLAEQDAHDRAAEILRQLEPELARNMGLELARFNGWARQWEEGRATWVQDAPTNAPWSASWAANYPTLDPEQTLFKPASVSETGVAVEPRLWTGHPTPAHWYVELSTAQSELWQAARWLESSRAADSAVAEAWSRVTETSPGPEAQANVELALLRLELRTNSAAAGIERLCRFADDHPDTLGESGLPLAAVCFAMALRQAETNDIDDTIVRSLEKQLVRSPSLLCPFFIEECKRLARADSPSVTEAVIASALTWQRQERWRELLRSLRQELDLRGRLATNVWVHAATGTWLALVSPRTSVTRDAGGPPSSAVAAPELNWIWFIPKSALELMFTRTVQARAAAWPGYFDLQAELEGEPMMKPKAHNARHTAAGKGRITLASQSGVLLIPTILPVNDTPGNATAPGSNVLVPTAPPRFTLAVYLGDADALYTRQRQRTMWFGGLILATAAAALVGFVRARRAFLREHQLGELKTNFVSSVSHELRAPIASVRLMAESLERGTVRDPARQAEYFGFIVQECRRLSALVANVLDFSRIEQGRKEYEFEPTDLVELVRETVKLMGRHAAEREVALTAELPGPGSPEEAPPLLDGRAIQQALVNLLDNALKHSPKQSCVRVSVQRVEPEQVNQKGAAGWRISVQDEGPGIPPSEHERIFERFYRLGSELRRDTQGVGIGLSIVKHIVEAHRGRILLESAPGQGSRFSIELPVA